MGKNKRSKSIGRMLIDLTPLLDVIFIVLIVVLVGRDSMNVDVNQKQAEAEQIRNEANQEVDDMAANVKVVEAQLEVFEELSKQFNVITISTNYNLQDRRYRYLRIKGYGNELISKELNPSNSEKVWNDFKTILEESVNEDENKETIIRIEIHDDEKMLYRDYEKMKSIINELQGIYPGKISIKE